MMLGEYSSLASALYSLLSEVVVVDRFEVSVLVDKFCESLVRELPLETYFLELSVWFKFTGPWKFMLLVIVTFL
jgi:hypothetical protein